MNFNKKSNYIKIKNILFEKKIIFKILEFKLYIFYINNNFHINHIYFLVEYNYYYNMTDHVLK